MILPPVAPVVFAAALWEATEQEKYPVLYAQSPCLYRMLTKEKKATFKCRLFI